MQSTHLNIKPAGQNTITLMPEEYTGQLSILWNKGKPSTINVDRNELEVAENCILFISEFYMQIETQSDSFRLIQFDKSYLSPHEDISDMQEYLMIFYGMHSIEALPKITLTTQDIDAFEQVWQQLINTHDGVNNPIIHALQRNSLQRFLLLSQQLHMETSFDIPIDFRDLKIIREFQFLVNNNFRELTKVSEYAEILKISPKKISELFNCCYSRKPSELIADRRNLFAKRQLIHTNELVKNIAYDLNFSDPQAFSHFFKKHNGISPEDFRANNGIT